MVLVLTNDDMERIEDLPMSAIIDAIEGAYRELGEGIAKSPPRRRLILPPTPENQTTYWFNNIMGAFPGQSDHGVASRFSVLSDAGRAEGAGR